MTPDRYEKVQEIFLSVCDHEPAERNRLLDEACASDAALRAEVERLLAADSQGQGLLVTTDPPAGSSARAGLGPFEGIADRRSHVPPPPEHIGRYAIRDVLGEGGMGIVYRAEQDQPRREVALKIIRPGVSSRQLLRRLEHEAELLGRLQHPGIAQIFEAGTADTGREPQPFFAMELARGQTITDYAREKSLSTRARLNLMIKICDAVEHAHQKGVIHRDLKPGNILVDESGQPKILDFGVARATDSDLQTTTLQTDVGQLIGTVPYMSPEQVAGDPAKLDTRSDVYSLGVVCYELLTGRLPYDLSGKTMPEAIRIVGQDDPIPLSSVNRALRGDLETLVGKSLEKDKERRYQSAAQFGADIQHYLRDEPIAARPASATYQLRKFARRHAGLAAGILIAATCLLGGTVASTALWLRAQTEAEIANREKANAEFTSDFLRDAFRSAWPEMPARELTVRELLDQAAAQLETEPPENPLILADLHVFVGEAYHALELSKLARPHFERALELRRAQLGEDHAQTLDAQRLLGNALAYGGDISKGGALLYETLQQCRDVLGPTHLVTAHAMLDVALQPSALPDDGSQMRLASEALALYEELLGPDHEKTLRAKEFAADRYQFMGKGEASEAVFREIIAQLRTSHGADPRREAELANKLIGLGIILLNQDRVDEAEECIEEALAIDVRVHGPGHGRTLAHRGYRAQVLRKRGQWTEAERELREILDGRRAYYRAPHQLTAQAAANLAMLLMRFGRLEEAQSLLAEAYEISRALHGPTSTDPQVLHLMIESLMLLTVEERRDEIVAEFNRLVGAGTATGPELLRAFLEQYRQKRMVPDAVALVQVAIEQPGALTGVNPGDALLAAVEMVEFLDQKGHLPAAEALCEDFLSLSRGRFPDTDPAMQRLIALQEVLGATTESVDNGP